MDINSSRLSCGVFERQIKLNLCYLTEAFNNLYPIITESIRCEERKHFSFSKSRISFQKFFFFFSKKISFYFFLFVDWIEKRKEFSLRIFSNGNFCKEHWNMIRKLMDVKQGNRIDVAIMTSNKYRSVLAQEASTTIAKNKENERITSIKKLGGRNKTRRTKKKSFISIWMFSQMLLLRFLRCRFHRLHGTNTNCCSRV